MASKTKRIWSKEELTIAYYIAKWDYSGLNISEDDFANYIITDTTVASLRMQTSCFRYLLGLSGSRLTHCSEAMRELVDELANKTISQVRRSILNYVDEQEESIKILTRQKGNQKINKKKDALNEQYRMNFENKVTALSKGRRLKKIVKFNK